MRILSTPLLYSHSSLPCGTWTRLQEGKLDILERPTLWFSTSDKESIE